MLYFPLQKILQLLLRLMVDLGSISKFYAQIVCVDNSVVMVSVLGGGRESLIHPPFTALHLELKLINLNVSS